jgi:hypothetical protein
MFWTQLTGGGVLSGVPAVFADQPFKGNAPHDLHAFYNPWLADNAHEYVPWQGFARSSLHAGVLPQGDPYVLAGAPVLANPKSSLFTPLNLPVWILPFIYGIGFVSVLKLWLAGLGTFLLGRRLGLGFWPSLVVGVAFGWSPFLIVWNQLDTVTIIWRDLTPGLRVGAAISALGIVLSGLWVAVSALRRKRASGPRSGRSLAV